MLQTDQKNKKKTLDKRFVKTYIKHVWHFIEILVSILNVIAFLGETPIGHFVKEILTRLF